MFDYCVAYYCTNDEPRHWHIKAEACVCYGGKVVAAAAAEALPGLDSCCPETLQVHHQEGEEEVS